MKSLYQATKRLRSSLKSLARVMLGRKPAIGDFDGAFQLAF